MFVKSIDYDMDSFSWFFFGDEGVTAIEYAMIALLIAAAIIGTVETLGIKTETLYNSVQSAFP